MNIGGNNIPQGPVTSRTKVSATTKGQTRGRASEDILAFSEEDFKTLSRPHNDALLILFLLNNIQIKRVHVDPGILANVVRSTVVEQLELLDRVIPTSRILNGFNMADEETEGEITLPVNVSDVVQDTRIHIIKGDTRYNSLLGRPWIHNMKAVPSTMHHMIKFPTKDRIKTIYGELHAIKETFAVRKEVPNSVHSSSEESESQPNPKDDEEDFLAPEPSLPQKSWMQRSRLSKSWSKPYWSSIS
ncbi:PREDICTED: uncharacterized protein LOC109232706 [Nicotiana attenuata]|uniref:uncharacterized protein LOC109232706 n=1 Tax=Nicotiana attenuata TaxID=49451 RepID=UPI000905A702|nr:PREDICTED: uncharacterized protein LOC109232706 [Nicotiana attenuata]